MSPKLALSIYQIQNVYFTESGCVFQVLVLVYQRQNQLLEDRRHMQAPVGPAKNQQSMRERELKVCSLM